MGGKNKSPTKDQQKRFQAIQDIGCLPCRYEGFYEVPCQIHHIVEGAYRRGHDHTYGNCPWHHMGQCFEGMKPEDMYRVAGPSLALNAKEYHERYGTERELVWEQDKLIKLWFESFV